MASFQRGFAVCRKDDQNLIMYVGVFVPIDVVIVKTANLL